MASSGASKLSREDFLKQKNLDEQRKAGTLPAEVDEEGRDINPHIPAYMANAPWYLDIGRPTLMHQRVQKLDNITLSEKEWHKRGLAATAATKYRKGACENCGAMTHKTKDCLDRPRKQGAKWTGKNIKPDEYIQHAEVDFDGKRDRWNGYDPKEHQLVVDQFNEIEEARRNLLEKKFEEQLLKAQAGSSQGASGVNVEELDIDDISSDEGGNDEELDELRYADRADMPGQKVDLKTRTTVRNLRLREDTAKYLRNLDVNSAYYDPKTRSMRENPIKDKDPSELTYAGDNFVRATGDAPKFNQMQLFAWDAHRQGLDVSLQADPTRAAMLHKEYEQKKEEIKSTVRDSIIAKYGGEEHLIVPPKEFLFAQSDIYVEYSKTGTVVKGQEKAPVSSKYEEDSVRKYGSNHSSVFGSYFDVQAKKWGFACCLSTVKNSYCTGKAGIDAAKNRAMLLNSGEHSQIQSRKSLTDHHLDNMLEKHRKRKTESNSESLESSKKIK